MSLVLQAQRHALEVKARLFSPKNAIPDIGINLKRKVIPIKCEDKPQDVPVTPLDVFGPPIVTVEDIAFGPLVSGPRCRIRLRKVMIEDIQALVSSRYGVSRTDIIADRRTKKTVLPRHVAIYLSRTLTTHSMPEIGRRFGGRDHSTVLHAVRKIEQMRQTDLVLNGVIIELTAILEADAQF